MAEPTIEPLSSDEIERLSGECMEMVLGHIAGNASTSKNGYFSMLETGCQIFITAVHMLYPQSEAQGKETIQIILTELVKNVDEATAQGHTINEMAKELHDEEIPDPFKGIDFKNLQ